MGSSDPGSVERLLELARTSPISVHIETDRKGVTLALPEEELAYYHSFVVGPIAQRARQSGQALLRACGNRQRSIRKVLDLTAGWGADGFTLASHGRQIHLLEQNPLLCAVLEYSRSRLHDGGARAAETAERMTIECAESSDYLRESDAGEYDCIFLDPMFPARKSGALPGRDMQILQILTGNTDIGQCLDFALERARNRVVVKRPARAPRLGEDKPDIVYREKSVRFDVYLTA